MADVSADPGLYTLNVNLSYEDANSNSKNIQTTAGLFVGGATDFDVSFSETSAGETSFSVANVGNNIAYAVKVSIPDQDGYKVSGSSSTIVGNLEKGDYTIASFDVSNSQSGTGGNTTGNSPGTPPDSSQADANGASSNSMSSSNPLKVQIEYTDAKGERETVTKEVNIETTSSGNMTSAGGPGGPGSSSGIVSYLPYIGLLIIAGGAFVYRRKIHEKVQVMKAKKSVYKKPEDQKV
jgi:hypothetical protein